MLVMKKHSRGEVLPGETEPTPSPASLALESAEEIHLVPGSEKIESLNWKVLPNG